MQTTSLLASSTLLTFNEMQMIFTVRNVNFRHVVFGRLREFAQIDRVREEQIFANYSI